MTPVSGSVYTVTVGATFIPAGTAELGLQLASTNHISDIAGNALSLAVTPATLQSLPTITLPAGESLMAVADVNGDGKDDLIIANSYTNSMSVMLGNGDGTLQNPRLFAVGVRRLRRRGGRCEWRRVAGPGYAQQWHRYRERDAR